MEGNDSAKVFLCRVLRVEKVFIAKECYSFMHIRIRRVFTTET